MKCQFFSKPHFGQMAIIVIAQQKLMSPSVVSQLYLYCAPCIELPQFAHLLGFCFFLYSERSALVCNFAVTIIPAIPATIRIIG